MLNKVLLFVFLLLNICFIAEGVMFRFFNIRTKLIVFSRQRYMKYLDSLCKKSFEERALTGLNGMYDYLLLESTILLVFNCLVGLVFLLTQWKINFASWVEVIILASCYGVISFARYSKKKDHKFIIRRTRDYIRRKKIYYVYLVPVVLQIILLANK